MVLPNWEFRILQRLLLHGACACGIVQLGQPLPTLMNQLYAGEVPPERAIRLREELEEVRTALALFPPRDVVWDFEEPSARPPWGDDIAETITLLANYFVTDDGRDLIDVLLAAVGEAQRHGRAIEVS